MVDQKSSLLERLKVCWNVLTKKNYVYFGIGKEPIVWDRNGKYDRLTDGALKCYTYISDDIKFMMNGKESNLHDMSWSVIEKFAKAAQEGKY